jgi:hypothetical protein
MKRVLGLLVVLAACSPQDQEPAVAKIELTRGALSDPRDAINLALPPDCRLDRPASKVDFEILSVICGGKPSVRIYAGNSADRDVPGSRLMTTPYAWPHEIQVWAEPSALDPQAAKRIAASVRVRAPNDG